MAATFCTRISLPALLVARLRHGAASATSPRRVVVAATMPVGAAKRMLGSVKCAAGALRKEAEAEAEAEVAVPRSVPVRVAYELQQAGHRYLDVRTEGEFSGGHPVGAMNIPYMYRTGSGMTKNSRFLEQVSAIFGKDDEIIIGCQSGRRSLMAAAELCSAGFTAVTDIAGGFTAWRENQLPISQ